MFPLFEALLDSYLRLITSNYSIQKAVTFCNNESGIPKKQPIDSSNFLASVLSVPIWHRAYETLNNF